MPTPQLDALPYDLADVERRRAAGETWAEIGAAYRRTKASAQTWYQRAKQGAMPSPERARATRFQPRPRPVEREAPPVEPTGEAPVDDADPYAEPARPVESAAVQGDASSSAQGSSRLGEDAARAYLPLLFGTMDSLAAVGAVWIVRRKLGERATTQLLEQARTLAQLSEGERAALEGALTQRLATVELTPNEALIMTLCAIYASKALMVAGIDAPADTRPVDAQLDAPIAVRVA